MVTHLRNFLLHLGSALILLSCGRLQNPVPDAVHRNEVQGKLAELSGDLKPLLNDGSVTTVQQLENLYSQRYPKAPPLFQTYDPAGVTNGLYPQLALPARDYFILVRWSSKDSASTPLLWTYFHTPTDEVVFLSIDGEEHHCSSNQFAPVVARLSGRTTRLTTK